MSTKPKPVMPAVHPFAEMFALHEGQPLWELADDIEEYGQREPILMYREMILDGRRRWLACLRKGIEPKTKEFKGTDAAALALVWSKNYHRRHLGVGERAMAAAKMVAFKDAQKTPPNGSANLQNDRIKIAETAGISVRTLQSGVKVLNSGEPELIAAVEDGTISVSDAAAVSDAPPAVQIEAVAKVKSGEADTAKEGAKDKPAVVDAFGNPIPKPLRAAYGDPWIQNSIDFLAKTEELIRKQRLIDGMDKRKSSYPFFVPKDFIDAIGMVQNTLEDALTHLKDFRPAGVCPLCEGKKCGHCLMSGMLPRAEYEKTQEKAKASA